MSPDMKHIVHFEDCALALHKALQKTRTVQLTHLQLRRCEAFECSALAMLLERIPSLRELDLAECVAINDDALLVVSQHLVGPVQQLSNAFQAFTIFDKVCDCSLYCQRTNLCFTDTRTDSWFMSHIVSAFGSNY